MSTIDQYLDELASRLRVGRRHRLRILAEARDHLDDLTTHHERAGAPYDRAVEQSLDAFGAPALVAMQFNAEAGTRSMRRAPFVAFAAGVSVVIGLLLAGRSQPHPATPVHALLATQISFFTAVLAFQVAVVAGLCAASRALAVWRIPTPRGDDREFVRRATRISTAALGVSVAGWTVTLVLALNRSADPNTAMALAGALIMVGGSVLAITTTYRLRVNASANAGGGRADAPPLFSMGERALALVARHPVISCATVAALSVWPAMTHAETTFTGALPWGIAQAVTVVVAFTVLGPALGLRRRVPRPTV